MGRRCGKAIASLACGNAWRHTRFLEQVVTAFEVLPERQPALMGALRYVLGCHAKWEDLHLEALLALAERGGHQPPDLVHDGIGHGVTADRAASAVHHEQR